jgi:hypothetical protein
MDFAEDNAMSAGFPGWSREQAFAETINIRG